MKNKKLVKILLPLTVVIWGFIIYRVISFVGNNDPINNMVTQQQYVTENTQPADTFTLVADYRDPFDVKSFRKSTTRKSSGKKKNTKTTNKKVANIAWPSIVFKGQVQNNNSSKKVSVIVINNKNYMMIENDEKDNVKLKKIYGDSVIVEFSNQEKTIYLKLINKN